MSMPSYNQLAAALTQIMFLINRDKDGSYFICEEAKKDVQHAHDIVEQLKKGEV